MVLWGSQRKRPKPRPKLVPSWHQIREREWMDITGIAPSGTIKIYSVASIVCHTPS